MGGFKTRLSGSSFCIVRYNRLGSLEKCEPAPFLPTTKRASYEALLCGGYAKKPHYPFRGLARIDRTLTTETRRCHIGLRQTFHKIGIADREFLWSLAEIGQYCALQPKTLKRFHRTQSFPMYKLGRYWVASKTAIRDWLIIMGKMQCDRLYPQDGASTSENKTDQNARQN